MTPKPAIPTIPTTIQATNDPYEPPSTDTRPAPPPNCDGVGAVTDVVKAPPGRLVVVVLAAKSTDDVCDGNGGRTVAENGVGSDRVAERAPKELSASALLAAYTLTVVVVVTVLEVGELRERLGT